MWYTSNDVTCLYKILIIFQERPQLWDLRELNWTDADYQLRNIVTQPAICYQTFFLSGPTVPCNFHSLNFVVK
jgi:hypothetical protein